MEEEKTIKEKLNEELEKIICEITEEGINQGNVEYLGEVIDIHKDLKNEEYWKTKEENMRYSNYGNYGEDMNYGRGRRRDSRGRYQTSGMYGRGRGRGSYGHEMIDEMAEHYGRYSEGREQGRRGNYSAKEDSMKSLEYMLQSVEDFMMMLSEEADSQEEVEMIKQTARKISDM